MHPAPTTASHRTRKLPDSVTDTRAAHWQRRLRTAGVGAAHGAGDMLSHSVHAALSMSSPVGSREPCGCRSIEAATLVELRLLPAARAGGERSAQPHPSWCAHVRRAHLMAAKTVSGASTVGSPAA